MATRLSRFGTAAACLAVALLVAIAAPAGASAAPPVAAPPTTATTPVERANARLALYLQDRLFNHFDTSVIDRYFGPVYTQHNPLVPDGPDALRGYVQYLAVTAPQSTDVVRRVIAQGDLVLLHSNAVAVPGTPGQAIVDIYRFATGRVVEHWDVIQDVPASTSSGNDMFSALTGSSGGSTRANEDLVARFNESVTAGRDLSAIDRFFAPQLVQHDPTVPNGRDALKRSYATIFSRHPQATFEVARILAQGDLVAVHAHYRSAPGELGQAQLSIYRVAHGRIVEMWTAVQDVPAQPANDNTMF